MFLKRFCFEKIDILKQRTTDVQVKKHAVQYIKDIGSLDHTKKGKRKQINKHKLHVSLAQV
jgi:hypothetical protein